MLQNEPLVAKIGVGTAENEPILGWIELVQLSICLLYTSDADDDLTRVDLGGRRII